MTTLLTARQRAFLRAEAHHLEPAARIGKEGVTGAALAAVEEALERRELIKVKVLEAAPDTARVTAERLAEMEGVAVVQVIGRVVVLYRPHPEKPQLVLPVAPKQ